MSEGEGGRGWGGGGMVEAQSLVICAIVLYCTTVDSL